MKPVLIVENNTSPLSLNESTKTSGKRDYILGGIFTEFGVKNRNERIYTADKFIPCLDELNGRINTMGVVYGEFDHPDVFDTSLSRASHIIKSTSYVKESNRVEGQIKLLNTYWGKEAQSLVDDGCPVFVSSRAAGITEANGTVSLKKLFTYDIVADPGFASARMSSVNESFGYTDKANFRIYEMSNESKINELVNMNKNEFVTKNQLTDYSKYIINEIASTKKEVKTALKSGNLSPKKLDQLLEYYDELNKTNSQVVKYLDYIAEKVQIVVNENKSLRTTTEKLVSHNDYLAENLEKSINYSEYLAESLDKNITYSEYLAENLDKNIAYSEYIAESVDKNITYSEYLAENLDKNIAYSEYIAENLDKNIAYSEYIAENLDKNIAYSEYIAENLDNTIAYSEYLSEHVEGNIAYSEYIAEHLDDNIAYSEYIAENLDKTVSYAGMISERLNGGRLNEGKSNRFLTLEEVGFDLLPEDDFQEDLDRYDANHEDEDEFPADDEDFENESPIELPPVEDSEFSEEECIDGDCEEETTEFHDGEEVYHDREFHRGNEIFGENYNGESDSDLSKQINKLIQEAKKRKVSETNDLHFLKFLNKSQVDSFYELSTEDKELVKLYINEKSYYTSSEVIKLISEALSVKNESIEEKLVRLMPENIKPIWSQINEASKKSILSQARLYPDLNTDQKVEHFWLTRNLKKNESVTRKLVSHESLIQEDRLSDKEVSSIMERFKSL
jgi:hypothetical protein